MCTQKIGDKMSIFYKCPYNKEIGCDMTLPCPGCEDFKGKVKEDMRVTLLDDLLPGFLKRSVGISFQNRGFRQNNKLEE